MSSLDTYGIDGEEEINVNTLNSHFIDDEDEQSFTTAGEGYASYSSFPIQGISSWWWRGGRPYLRIAWDLQIWLSKP